MKYSETQQRAKRQWTVPELIVHGRIEDITQSKLKHKVFGAGDDVSLLSIELTETS